MSDKPTISPTTSASTPLLQPIPEERLKACLADYEESPALCYKNYCEVNPVAEFKVNIPLANAGAGSIVVRNCTDLTQTLARQAQERVERDKRERYCGVDASNTQTLSCCVYDLTTHPGASVFDKWFAEHVYCPIKYD